jgi:CRISPR-associated protein Csm5
MRMKMAVELPLHIGSNDYIYLETLLDDKDKKEIYMLANINKMAIDSKLRSLFMDFYNSKNIDMALKKIQDYYRSRKDIDSYKIYPPIKYKYHGSSPSEIKMPVGTYSTDGKKFMPYIPGSSIKGSIKNALASYIIKNKKINFSDTVLKKDNKRRWLEFILFNYNDKSNFSSFIEVSDFIPFTDPVLSLYELKRIKQHTNDSKIISYNVMVDGGTFKGDISISNKLDYLYRNRNNKSGSDYEDVSNYINKIFGIDISSNYEDNKEELLNKILEITYNFSTSIINDEKTNYDIDQGKKNLMLLGYGGGIEEKTIIKALPDEIFEKLKDYILSKNSRKNNKLNKNSRKNNKLKLNEMRLPSTAWKLQKNEKFTKFGVVSCEKC